MSGSTNLNTSQDPDYVGPTGFEKKFHQTHFQGVRTDPTHPKDDPNWVYLGVGRWKRIRAGDMPEVTDAIQEQKTTRMDEDKQT